MSTAARAKIAAAQRARWAKVNDPIRRTYMRLSFRRTNDIRLLTPWFAEFQIIPPNLKSHTVAIYPTNSNHTYLGKRLENAIAYDISIRSDERSITRKRIFEETKWDNLLIPAHLWETQAPYQNLRDLDHSTISVCASSNLVAETRSIEWIVNGWVILQLHCAPTNWIQYGERFMLRASGPTLHRPAFGHEVLIRRPGAEYLTNFAGAVTVLDKADERVFTKTR